MQIYEFNNIVPVIHKSSFIHESAVIIGDVFIGENVYIGPNCSIRGDFGRIIIKNNSNVQDACVIHSFPSIDVILEEKSHIGHSAILHGCHIKYNAMVGMNSVIMDESVVGENSIIGAMSLVPSKKIIPPNYLAYGNPIKLVRELREDEISWKTNGTDEYSKLALDCINTLKKCSPLKESNDKRDSLRTDIDFKPKGN